MKLATANPVLYAKLIKALFSGATLVGLEAYTGLSLTTVKRWVKALHDAENVYISGWVEGKREGVRSRPVYKLTRNPCPDAPRPPRQSRKETDARYRENKKLKAQRRNSAFDVKEEPK